MASTAQSAHNMKKQNVPRRSRRKAGRSRSMTVSRSNCSVSDSLSLNEPNEQSYIKEGLPQNTRIKVCHKRTQYDIFQSPICPEESSNAPDPYEYSEEIEIQGAKTSTPSSGGAPASNATTKVANKNVQAGCVVCDPLPEIVRHQHIIVEGVEPVRRSSLRNSDSTSASPESSSSNKKSVSFNIRSYRQLPKCVYCITIVILSVVLLSPVIYLAVTSKAARAVGEEETMPPREPPQSISDLNATSSHSISFLDI
ncbi:uncharacterized protein [Dermacentor albipictus]|uniref:uncharacterized protein isoform X1 n=1 Tax=Dermacentor albipictus TaxID=60249 RepID=UPI0038FD2255